MSHLVLSAGRLLALAMLVASLVNLCLCLKLAVCLDETYAGMAQLIVPLVLVSFGLWSAGCLLNRAACTKAGKAL